MKWLTATLLFLTLLALMVVNSSEFFFHQAFYEVNDWAANSISVNRAKHFSELYGNYSRWGFHHPGPAFFYLYALGEWLLYDTLHLVAAPFNGQLFAHLVLMTGYFVAILTVFSRWLPDRGGPWFVPLAIAASALHFSVMADLAPDLIRTLHAPSAIASPWSAHALVMPFLCLLTVGASVAAGQGRHLPLLAFADGCLIHTHVAQPMFVLPLTFLAYAGLGWRGWRTRRAPWREFGRAHRWAFLILAMFALPIVGDLFRGANSNFAMIRHHLQIHHGEHKPLARSVVYFLQFGSYTEYAPFRNVFGHYDLKGEMRYLGRNAAYYVLWLAATILALKPLATSFRLWRTAAAPRPDDLAPDAHRFLAWGGAYLIIGCGLTIVWGVIQDGPMTYFNAWFNYSIYHFVALLALAALCARPETVADAPRRWAVRLGAVAVAAGICVLLAGPLRVEDPALDQDLATRTLVQQAIDDSNVPGRPPATKLLLFTQETWEIAAGVALHLDRAHQPFVVPIQWAVVVGNQHLWSDFAADLSPKHLQIFRLHGRHASTIHQPAYALQKTGGALTIVPPLIDPNDAASSTVEFRPRGSNFLGYQVIGWGNGEEWGTWSDGHVALLALHPQSAGGKDVELRLDAMPLVSPKDGLTGQRILVFFNGEPLGRERFMAEPEKAMAFTIPSALWEKAVREPASVPTMLGFRLPDASAPQLVNPEMQTNDFRLLGLGFHQLRFRLAEPKSTEEDKEQGSSPGEKPTGEVVNQSE